MFQQNPNVAIGGFPCTDAPTCGFDTSSGEFASCCSTYTCYSVEVRTRTVQNSRIFLTSSLETVVDSQRQVQTQPRVGFGSGVIISKDGYIVTNNHVIEGADEISVKLNDNRELKGRIIGTDPSTDLGLIKIEGDDLPDYSGW